MTARSLNTNVGNNVEMSCWSGREELLKWNKTLVIGQNYPTVVLKNELLVTKLII